MPEWRSIGLLTIGALAIVACLDDPLGPSMSEGDALRFAAERLCPNFPDEILPGLHAVEDTADWSISVGDVEPRIAFRVAEGPDGPFLSPFNDEAREYLQSRPASCFATPQTAPTSQRSSSAAA